MPPPPDELSVFGRHWLPRVSCGSRFPCVKGGQGWPPQSCRKAQAPLQVRCVPPQPENSPRSAALTCNDLWNSLRRTDPYYSQVHNVLELLTRPGWWFDTNPGLEKSSGSGGFSNPFWLARVVGKRIVHQAFSGHRVQPALQKEMLNSTTCMAMDPVLIDLSTCEAVPQK